MTSIILGSAGAAALNFAGPLASAAGYSLGSMIGRGLDGYLFNSEKPRQYNKNLQELFIQSSIYGRYIPRIFGTCKLAGNIIWASSLRKSSHKINSGGSFAKGLGRKKDTKYNYSLSFAIGLCSGEIDEIGKIWINEELVDKSTLNFRLYKGTSTQEPDHLIESIEGAGKVPAFRDMAYVVFEDFNISVYGNMIPNFTFEITASSSFKNDPLRVENNIRQICLIPGSGEFVYDTAIVHKDLGGFAEGKWISFNKQEFINKNTTENKADAVVAIDDLLKTCPNLEYVNLVVCWFADDLQIKQARILPCVEQRFMERTYPNSWQVGAYTRSDARLISKDDQDRPLYGGTCSDHSLLRMLQYLKSRNIKVLLNPMIMCDIADKPWRGNISGQAEDVSEFFSKSGGYNEFILHYAKLCNGLVDSFLIGSELKALTAITDGSNYPAVTQLCKLADQVKSIMGDTKISYAADWSEYHHDDCGNFYMDELWARDSIDYVGVDAYFPLTDLQRNPTLQEVKEGWGCDANNPEYNLKNIFHWWSNTHTNPDGTQTRWRPQMKKIWFTEFGFPSVDLCSNQPNVFFDPTSRESNLPHHSHGSIDFAAQNLAIKATLEHFKDSEMVEKQFLWCWDARPYPAWPGRSDIWSDGQLWARGHWVNGKIGHMSLSDLIISLLVAGGVDRKNINISDGLDQQIRGLILQNSKSVAENLLMLQDIYDFAMTFEGEKINVSVSISAETTSIHPSHLIWQKDHSYQSYLKSNRDITSKIELDFVDALKNYDISSITKSCDLADSKSTNWRLPMILDEISAGQIAANLLAKEQSLMHEISFRLPSSFLGVKVFDLIEFTTQIYQVRSVTIGTDYSIEIEAVKYTDRKKVNDGALCVESAQAAQHDFELRFLSLEQNKFFVAAHSKIGFSFPISLYENNSSLGLVCQIESEATHGVLTKNLALADSRIDESTQELQDQVLHVHLNSGQLRSCSLAQIEAGHNLAFIGSELIAFSQAQYLGHGNYLLTGLLRAQKSTKPKRHLLGERFILLDDNLVSIDFSSANVGSKKLIAIANEVVHNYELPLIKEEGVILDLRSSFECGSNAEFTKASHPELVSGSHATPSFLPPENLTCVRMTSPTEEEQVIKINFTWSYTGPINPQFLIEINIDGCKVKEVLTSSFSYELELNKASECLEFSIKTSAMQDAQKLSINLLTGLEINS